MSSERAKIAVVYYSTWGHIYQMAQAVVRGIEAEGGDVTLYRIAETLPSEVLAKMHSAPPPVEVPIVKVDDLIKYDGIIFGAPTRFGQPAAQYKALWDATGQLWTTGGLDGKLASFFTGTSIPGGGQETTASTNMGHFVHHGMIFVPMGYGDPNKSLFNLNEVHGGSPWGAGTFSDMDASRQPTKNELGQAEYQGRRFAKIANQYVRGRANA
jgi:NAD(P)H dehydrogenase (quinone)